MSEKNVKIVRGFKVPIKEGSHFRVMCMTGENQGMSYYLLSKRILMGRGNTVDIQVMDTKSSREHAELKLVNKIYVISDLSSQNGITVNDLKIKQHNLKSGDKIIIGQTVFKFDLLENKDLALISKNEESKAEEDDDIDESPEKTKENEKTKKRILVILAVFMVIYFFLDEEKPTANRTVKNNINKIEKDSFAELLRNQQVNVDNEQKKKLQTIIHRGLRELREFNYARAIEEFNLALVLSPNNGRAQFYLSKAEQRLYDEVDKNLIKAKREEAALKYNAAVVSYCSVIRLLRKYPSHEKYKDAEAEIKKLEPVMDLEENEINCLSSGEY